MSSQSYNITGGRVIKSQLSATQSITGAVTALIVCIGLFIYLNSLGIGLVKKVRTGHPRNYPNITYEEAFSRYYKNPKWENASTNDQKIVRFSGECSVGSSPTKVVMNFWVDDNSFILHDGTVNGETGGVLELFNFNNQPFETYRK